jgi:hypothetical protein
MAGPPRAATEEKAAAAERRWPGVALEAGQPICKNCDESLLRLVRADPPPPAADRQPYGAAVGAWTVGCSHADCSGCENGEEEPIRLRGAGPPALRERDDNRQPERVLIGAKPRKAAPMEAMRPRTQQQRKKAAATAAKAVIAAHLEPSGRGVQRSPRQQDVDDVYALIGVHARMSIDASTFNEMANAAGCSRRESDGMRKVLREKDVKVDGQLKCKRQRTSDREEKAPETRWLYPDGDTKRGDAAYASIGEAVRLHIAQRDPDGRWVHGKLLLCLTLDGTGFGKAKKASVQTATVRVLNQRDGTRSVDNTIVFSLAQAAETKEGLAVVIKMIKDEISDLHDHGLLLDGEEMPRACEFFMVNDEKAVTIMKNLAGTSSNHCCNYCCIRKSRMKLLDNADIAELRDEATCKKYTEKLACIAEEIESGYKEPFLKSGVHYSKLQKKSSGSSRSGQYDADNCRSHMGTPNFFGLIPCPALV